MSVTITMTKAQAELIWYLLSVHSGPVPNYSWTRRDMDRAGKALAVVGEAIGGAA